jgi:type IV pilus assembly protein PilB
MPRTSQVQKLLEILVEAGKLTDERSVSLAAQAAKGGDVEQLLLDEAIVDDEFLAKAKGTLLNVPYVDLVGKEIPADVLNLLPKEAAESAKAIAFARQGDDVDIATLSPRDPQAMQSIDFLAQTKGFRARYHIMTVGSYQYALKRYQELGKEVAKALEVAKEKFVAEEEQKGPDEERIEDVIRGAPVSRIVQVILRHAVEGNASDVHIEPHGEETRVRYRVDGVLRTSLTLPKYIHPSLVARVKVLANLKLDETRIPQDGRIRETFGSKIIDFRVSTLPLSDTEKVEMRILDTTRGVPSLTDLGFRDKYVEIIEREIRQPHGMFLITGPTGSGKSTTLFTILNMRNEEGINISTLEDPVEYQILGVNQSQVRPEVGYTFAAGLRALLRQDPNVIMVGEIRDSETGELAIHAALTGHMLFSTLHTNDSMGVIPRLTDMHLEPFLLAATMNIAIAQRLARRICERCKTTTTLGAEMEERVRKMLMEIPESYRSHIDVQGKLTFYRGRGCLRCGDTGYVGRVAVAEVLEYTDKLKELVTGGWDAERVRTALKQQGFLDLKQDGVLKALEGFTTIEEVLRISAE